MTYTPGLEQKLQGRKNVFLSGQKEMIKEILSHLGDSPLVQVYALEILFRAVVSSSTGYLSQRSINRIREAVNEFHTYESLIEAKKAKESRV